MDTKQYMQKLGICVVIPTYNNSKTIDEVIGNCLKWTASVIVVNDGSTDGTDRLLSRYATTEISVVSYTPNRGKGYALKSGFAFAKAQGFSYAITIDADGQHFASDIPAFVETILSNPGTMVVGSRNIAAENMPAGNTFANKFSNFWFRIQTLQSLPDTQSGYRLYPLRKMGSLWWMTCRYEAELELLVFAAWHGIKLIPIPINVYYPPANERVSHFRPRMDFLRISIVNTVLCMLAIIYGGPRMLISRLVNKMNNK